MADDQMDEIDRLAERSLAAREAEARASRRGSPVPWAISGLLFAFLLGLLASPWFERQVRGTIPGALAVGREVDADPQIDSMAARIATLEAELAKRPAPSKAEQPAGGLAQRLAAVEAKAATLESADGAVRSRIEGLATDLAQASSSIAEGDARLRDLFLLAVARRMLEAGRPLTPLQTSLDTRFRTREAAALDTLRAWSLAPQTVRTLEDRLETLQVQLAREPASAGSWWDRMKRSFSRLVQVKGATEAQAKSPETLLAEARAALEKRDLAQAADRAQAIDTPEARQWAADARLLQAANAALDRLDALAIENSLAVVRAAVAQPATPPLNAPAAP
jgi:hypothetical protein